MRTGLIVLGAAAVAVAQEYGSEGEIGVSKPHMTTESTLGFVTESIYLSRDLTVFLGSAVFNVCWDNVPPKIQSQITEKYEDGLNQFQSFRMKHGVPSVAQISEDVTRAYKKNVKPHFTMVWSLMDKMVAQPASKFVTPLLAKFEQQYPQNAGKLPAHLFDLALLCFFLYYYVVATMWNLLCCVLCCGCCRSRKSSKPELVKKKPQPVPAGKKKN